MIVSWIKISSDGHLTARMIDGELSLNHQIVNGHFDQRPRLAENLCKISSVEFHSLRMRFPPPTDPIFTTLLFSVSETAVYFTLYIDLGKSANLTVLLPAMGKQWSNFVF